MRLPAPPALLTRARALAALDARALPDPISREYTERGGAWVHDNGGGDHCVIRVLGDRLLIKAFDHESDDSRWMRDPQVPDPRLTEGMPTELLRLLAEPVDDLEGEDRTFCAWWDGRWTTRGEPGPAEAFLVDAAEVVERMRDSRVGVDEGQVAALLEGRLSADAVTIDAIVERPVAGPPGWTFGEPFVLVVSTARSVSSVPLIKRVRELTGASLGEIKRALADQGPLLELRLQRHAYDQVRNVGTLGEVLRALEPEGGARFRVGLPGQALQDADEAMVRGMLGPDTLWLDPR
ncbi:MAG: hypothetical protein H6738_01865 [Alphaproteobacteria bacterium]|nr:hypothetical protein [Alphaproteobacteria bacterium]MCB9695515.1 hypothetical protein [Alphaproteobacteria bacterium]